MLKPYIVHSIKFVLLLVTFAFSMVGTFYSYVEFGIGNIHYFTNQSNLLVFVVSFMMVFGFDKSKWFKALSSIALLDILLTGVVYNLLLREYDRDFNEIKQFLMLVTHTIVPILFTTLYFGFIQTEPLFKDIKLLWIHPTLYFLVAQIAGLFTGYYPYPFISPEQGVFQMLIVNFFIVFPILTLTGLGLIGLKQWLNEHFNLV
ncbi:Pr6Pr family membrane protein [Acholeplasma vituli]|uniref:Pr6Pr family membrane protein n=1 Tax=Paracholeplasma vituli TaxID=69473 RepID=A0ABT2PXD9_9MOLU|nr:Pr6Pr family membrane protein [Paracholeplasma vituli]MCU0105629.1 Pr6Pr family membrane protein [Paracholeplasma vituli]